MRAKVYKYVNVHSHCSVNDIAKAVDCNGLEVMKYLLELSKEGYVKMDTPIPLSANNNNSVYYSATGKIFLDQ